MSEPLTVGINKLSLRAGDVVVVRVGFGLTDDLMQRIREQTHDAFPSGIRVLVLSGEIDLTVMRNGVVVEPVPAEHDAPAIVTVP